MKPYYCAADLPNGRREFFTVEARDFDEAMVKQDAMLTEMYGHDVWRESRLYAPADSREELAEDLYCIDHDC